LIAILDRDGKRLYNSPSYRPLVGDVESLLGTLSFQEVHPDDRELVERAFRETIATGVGRRLEYRFRHKDGTIRFIESQGGVIHDADGRPSKVVVVSRDITERKLAEQAIRDAEQRFRRLLESTTDYIFSVTVQDGRAVATTHSQACLPITGYTAREFDTDEYLWFRIIHPDDRDAVLAQVAQVLKGETPLPLEHRIYHKSGRLRWIRNLLVPHKDLQGQVVAYDGLISNITERKEAELALQASQERLALVIRGSNDGIWDWDVTTSEVYFSPRWKAMLGYEDREIEDKFSSWEHLVHPEDRERARAEVRAYFEGRAPTYELEHRLRHKDGSYRWVLARGVALRDAAGKPLRMAGSHVDLTERKAAEERLQRANAELAQNEEALRRTLAELKAANEELKVTQRQLIVAARLESVGTLAAGVAHEVKNPLQIIVMGLDYVAKNAPPGNQAFGVVLHDMRVAVDRANAIIGEVLKFSADKEFDLQPDDLNAVIDRSLLLTRYELVSHGIALVPELAPALPPVRLNCSKLEQVFVNLFVNAIHAMPNGGALTVRTRVQCPADGTADPEPDEVVVEVQDTGTGIADEHLPRVFDPFFTTKPIGAGTGLGLSVVKKIIDLHGGVIEIRNVAEGGVCVTLRFKARQRST
jgi:PAS domain S-box-containing protein